MIGGALGEAHCEDFLDNLLPSGCAKLIIADPPYYRTKGAFDFVWDTFEDYLADVELWARECRRLLADNGTLLWWGSAKRIAYTQVLLDKHFNLINSLVWEKTDAQTRKNTSEQQRSFIPVTERLLVYDNGDDLSGLARIDNDPELFLPIKMAFDEWHDATGLTLGEVTGRLGSSCTHWIGFSKRNKTQFAFPTREKFEAMGVIHPMRESYGAMRESYEAMRESYEAMRESYEAMRRPFTLGAHRYDVINAPQQSHLARDFKHDTKKPEGLTQYLIETCSRAGDLVVVPFAGSGTECAMSARTLRPWVAFDTDKRCVDMANERAKRECPEAGLY